MKKLVKLIKTFVLIIISVIFLAGTCFGIKGYKVYKNAVQDKSLEERIEEIQHKENYVTYDEIPEFYINALISVEDHRFRYHLGIDPIAIGRAALADIKAGSFVQGGSTITQQLAKNLLFTNEKTINRKLGDMVTALILESKYSKNEILELYANVVYFGSGYYGIKEASKGYFNKEPKDLTKEECIALAGIPNSPSTYSPNVNKKLTQERSEAVLESMIRYNFISQQDVYLLKEIG